VNGIELHPQHPLFDISSMYKERSYENVKREAHLVAKDHSLLKSRDAERKSIFYTKICLN
jgi:hypothetical protein